MMPLRRPQTTRRIGQRLGKYRSFLISGCMCADVGSPMSSGSHSQCTKKSDASPWVFCHAMRVICVSLSCWRGQCLGAESGNRVSTIENCQRRGRHEGLRGPAQGGVGLPSARRQRCSATAMVQRRSCSRTSGMNSRGMRAPTTRRPRATARSPATLPRARVPMLRLTAAGVGRRSASVQRRQSRSPEPAAFRSMPTGKPSKQHVSAEAMQGGARRPGVRIPGRVSPNKVGHSDILWHGCWRGRLSTRPALTWHGTLAKATGPAQMFGECVARWRERTTQSLRTWRIVSGFSARTRPKSLISALDRPGLLAPRAADSKTESPIIV